jgi:hypothetical protein
MGGMEKVPDCGMHMKKPAFSTLALKLELKRRAVGKQKVCTRRVSRER